MAFRNPRNRKVQVILNVYDLAEWNNYGYSIGFGAFHTGVEVHGTGNASSSSGIFTVEPKTASGARFRESIVMGETNLSSDEIRRIADNMESDFIGNSYNVMTKNCNHFSDALCQKLVGKSIPGYINRLAYYGNFLSCVLPSRLNQSTPNANNQNTTSSTSSTPTPQFTAFSGNGMKLAETIPTPSREDDLRNRRERLAAAAAQRTQQS